VSPISRGGAFFHLWNHSGGDGSKEPRRCPGLLCSLNRGRFSRILGKGLVSVEEGMRDLGKVAPRCSKYFFDHSKFHLTDNWNTGITGSWIGITLKEVGGASACGELEAEGQEFFASCLSEAILKRSAPEPKGPLSQLLIPNIPTFHCSIGFNSQSELLFRVF